MFTQHILRLREYILEKRARNNAQRDFAINASEGQVIDLIAEGRNVRPLAGIHIHGQNIFTIKIEMRSEFKSERGVSAFVFPKARTVQPHGGCCHYSFEVDGCMFSTRFRGNSKMAPVT